MARYYKITEEEKLNLAKEFLNEVEEQNAFNNQLLKDLIPHYDKLWGFNSDYGVIVKGFRSDSLGELVGWKKNKEGVFMPNTRSKLGKEIQSRLDKQKRMMFFHIEDKLKIKLTMNGRFTTPKLWKLKTDEIILQCDQRINLERSEFEEVTFTYVEDNY